MYQCHVIHHALVQQSQVVFISSLRDKFPASVSVRYSNRLLLRTAGVRLFHVMSPQRTKLCCSVDFKAAVT